MNASFVGYSFYEIIFIYNMCRGQVSYSQDRNDMINFPLNSHDWTLSVFSETFLPHFDGKLYKSI